MDEIERRPLGGDRRIRWGGALVAAGAGALAYAVAQLSAGTPTLVERLYAGGVWPVLSRPLSLATGVVPFAVAELFLAGYGVWILGISGLSLHAAATGQRRWRNALASGGRRVLLHGGLAVALFYGVWGLNYSRAPFEARVGWPAWEGAEAEELLALAEEAVEVANAAYLELHGSADAGHPTLEPDEPSELDAALEEGWRRTAPLLDLPPIAGRRFGRVKRPLASGLLAHLGISGVYVPYTGEATVLAGLPAMRVPYAMAHESAHQRGVGNESEASFLGFVTTTLAPHPLARYSGSAYAMGQLLTALRRADREAWERLRGAVHPGVRRDFEHLAGYLSRYEGTVERVANRVNDRYLRANRVPGGVRSYGRSIRLLVEFARQNGGTLFPERVSGRSEPEA